MSKGDVIRRIVTERLAAASQEILAVVDKIVAGYEEEASGFRQEIERQRRQLEELLQPEVRLKAGVKRSRSLFPAKEEEGEDEDEESPEHPENLEDPTNQSPARCFTSRGQYSKTKKKPGRPQISEAESHVELRIRILEDLQTDVLTNSVLKKCPLLKLKCPRGLQEADFIDLLKSTFPQLSGGDKRFDMFTSDKRRRLQPLKLQTVTPEEISRNISCSGWGKSTLFIRPETQKEFQTNEEDFHPTEDNNTEDSLSTSVLLTCDETRPQTSNPVQEVEGRTEDSRVSSSSTSQQRDIQDGDYVDHRTSEPAEDFVDCTAIESKTDGIEKEEERGESRGSDDDWKQDKNNEELRPKTKKKQKVRRSGLKAMRPKTERADVFLSCKVCGALHKSEVTLVKHAWSHVDDPESLCGVCGEHLESEEVLKDHLQSRHKTEDCHICGESFLSTAGLDEHVAAHSGEKPYECDVCCEAFALKASLENHQKLHKAGKLHRCFTCHKVFELKEQLKAHCRTHSNKKTRLCGVCGKSLSDYRSLSRHKMTHSEERPHICQVCGRRFKLPGTLKQHKKIHTDRERSYLCDVCCKMFLTSKELQIHMRRHTNEKPYHCGECGKGFSTKGPLTIHMRVHTGETPYRCPDCGWSFKRKVNLDNHLTVHSGQKPFVCGICGKACARKTYLTVHMRTHNGERPYKCTLCDKAFTQGHCLKTHMKSHLVAEAAT